MKDFFKSIVLLKNIRSEYQVSGTLLNAVASRKMWGAFWMFAAHVLRGYVGFDFGDELAIEIANFCANSALYVLEGWGIAMQVKSYIEMFIKMYKKAKEKKNA